MSHADKPSIDSALSIYHPTRDHNAMMLRRGGQKPSRLVYSPAYRLGLSPPPTLANEAGPSACRQYTTGQPVSWSVIRKGKQRAGAAIREGTSMSALTRHRNPQPPYRTVMQHSRHFHASRPRHALPLIPATAAILKVSLRGNTAYIIVDIDPHRHHLRVPNSHLVLSYRYTGCF